MRTLLIILGAVFLVEGMLTVFSNRYFAFMRKTLWKRGKLDEKLFPGKSGDIYIKYVWGLKGIVIGLGALLFAIFAF